jgi:catechol 2,3-dioxygenase-like lactoylglutathione lyase family enzyme
VPEAPPAHEPSHLGLCVSDLDASRRFYCEGLGFTAAAGLELSSRDLVGLDGSLEVPGPATITSQFITLGELKIELLGFHEPASHGVPSQHRNQLGLTHLSFLVDDVDAAAARLTEFGGTILEDTRSNPGIDIVFLADPDGVRVELMGRPT